MISTGQASALADLDEAALRELCDEDLEFASELLETFIECQEVAMADLCAALQNRDFEGLKKIAHFTKGGARSIAAPRLSSAAEALECAMNRQSYSHVDSLTSEVRQAYGQLKTIILNR